MSGKGKRGGSSSSKKANEAIDAALANMSLKDGDKNGEDQRTVTGVLCSHPLARDIKFENFSLQCFGTDLITNTTLELNYGRRYGLIGSNGCGKTTFLKSLAARDLPIGQHIDIFMLSEGAPPTELSALEAVIADVRAEYERLETLAEDLACEEDVDEQLIESIYERLDEMDPSTFESRAGELLFGLGFSQEMMHRATKDMSGGWRMRVALAKALFIKPAMLLLDEPTAHLDLEACVWLEDYLSKYNRILIIVSHSQDFLNGVCTNIMHLFQTKLINYTGNYDMFVKTRSEREANQMKAYHKQQEEIAHIKQFIASCGTYANLVRQAKSRQKILDKMEADGLIQEVVRESRLNFRFPETGKLPPPVISFSDVSFSYSGRPENFLYRNLEFGVHMDSRIALVGPNGVGKSTLLKLMIGELDATLGRVSRHPGLKIGRYHQHSVDQLDLNASPVEYMQKRFASLEMGIDNWRKRLGQFGLTGKQQTNPIRLLSDGQRARVCFAEMAVNAPNMLLLDEPTNSLDIECIDSLADALKAFDGGVILVSHDFRLIDQVADEIWVCENQTITKWEADIREYKEHLRKNMTLKK